MFTKLRNWVASFFERAATVKPVAPPRKTPPTHALDIACVTYACRYDRSVLPSGEVQMRLIRNDATLLAVGLTTADAVQALLQKADDCWRAL